MTNFNPEDLIESGSGAIPNGQLAPVMRRSMENKNLLVDRGSIYVGTGTTYDTLDSEDGTNTYKTAITQALPPPEEGLKQVLTSDVDNAANPVGLKWQTVSFETAKVNVLEENWTEVTGKVGEYKYTITSSDYGFSARTNLIVQLMPYNSSGGFTIAEGTVDINSEGVVEIYSNVSWAGQVLILGL